MIGPRVEGLQLADEVGLIECVRRGRPERPAVPAGRVDTDPAIGVDQAPAEDDRRDVPLAGGTQAHEEADRAWWHVGLIHRRDDRRVEQGGRLDRVLHREAGADQPPLSITDRAGVGDVVSDRLVVLEEDVVDIRVPRPEVAVELGQEGRDVCHGDGQQPPDDVPDPVHLPGVEEPGDDSARIRQELDRQARHMDGHRNSRAAREAACLRGGEPLHRRIPQIR